MVKVYEEEIQTKIILCLDDALNQDGSDWTLDQYVPLACALFSYSSTAFLS